MKLLLYNEAIFAVLLLFVSCLVSICWANKPDTSHKVQPIYSIIASSSIRSNSNYHVSVHLGNASQPVKVKVQIVKVMKYSKDQGLLSTNLIVNPLETKIHNLQIGHLVNGEHKLIVHGKSEELNFAHEANLKVEPKSYSVFIQTDKAVYKPGQMVHFRVIVVNQNFIPILNGAIDILIRDSQENLIKQWKRLPLHLGIVTQELQLSEQPPLGDWSIMVDGLEGVEKYTKTFTIEEYVLPTFSVDIHLPPYIAYNRPNVIVTVSATYTYGRPVKGECMLWVKYYDPSAYAPYRNPKYFQSKLIQLTNGSADIPLNIVEEFEFYNINFSEYKVEFFAEVQDSLTGKKSNKTAQLKLYKNDVKLELIKTTKTYKPGFKYSAYLKVAYRDDTPVEDNGPPVRINYGFGFKSNFTLQNKFEAVPLRGIVHIEVYPPNATQRDKSMDEFVQGGHSAYYDEINSISWKAEYRGNQYDVEPIQKAHSPSNSFIQISIAKNDDNNLLFNFLKLFTIGQNVTFNVNSTEPMSNLIYEVMAKGDIVLAGSVVVPELSNTNVDIMIGITRDMAPSARILVYYIREDNHEIVADALNFKVDGIFHTPVQLYSSLNQTEPGQLINISIHTNPYAFVGLLGLDQSVLLVKSENDITRENILKNQESYYGVKNENEYSQYHTASGLFKNSGLIFITNGFHHQKQIQEVEKFKNSEIDRKINEDLEMNLSVHEIPEGVYYEDQNDDEPIEAVEPVIRLRQNFPETWIWTNVSAGSDGIANYSANIPDSITSWYISAFAMDANTGLGVAEDNLKINVFRPFFIKLSLPYSIIRGETVSIQVLLFNYQTTPVNVEVVMQNEKDEFDFVDISENKIRKNQQKQRKQGITVPAFDGVSVNFQITPKILGNIDIKVKAQCANAGDAVVRKLLVKPEGQPQYFNKAMLVKLDSEYANTVKENFSIEIPQNAVPGSVRVQVSGISDILGLTLNHIDDLLRMPYGCGEQNMINLVPNIVVLNYLTRVKRLTPAIKTKAINHISSGYQRELTYRRDDGSFSAFGTLDIAGSTWLTTFVLKSFVQSRAYIDVDQKVMDGAIEFLVKQQNEDGSFEEKGEVHHKELQGGAVSGESAGALTAYVLIAILHESNSTKMKYKDEIKRAEDYIWGRLTNSSENNPYETSIIVQALHLANSEHKDFAYAKLMTLANHVDGLMYWPGKLDSGNLVAGRPGSGKHNPGKHNPEIPDPLEVETTAYALLTLMSRSDMDNGLPTLRWLISKQNSNGGFASTQDTAIGLQALGSIAERLETSKLNMSVTLKTGNGQSIDKKFEFTTENALVLQQIEIHNPEESKWVELRATGFGSAIVQVSVQYNIAEETEKPAFYLNQNQILSNSTNSTNLQMNICTFYNEGNSTNMAVLEIELPSGYNADLESLGGITQIDGVKRADTANNDGTVYVYFDKITQNETCISVSADRAHQVANHKPKPITVYDYYDRSKLTRIFYEPTEIKLKHDESPTTVQSTLSLRFKILFQVISTILAHI